MEVARRDDQGFADLMKKVLSGVEIGCSYMQE